MMLCDFQDLVMKAVFLNLFTGILVLNAELLCKKAGYPELATL